MHAGGTALFQYQAQYCQAAIKQVLAFGQGHTRWQLLLLTQLGRSADSSRLD